MLFFDNGLVSFSGLELYQKMDEQKGYKN